MTGAKRREWMGIGAMGWLLLVIIGSFPHFQEPVRWQYVFVDVHMKQIVQVKKLPAGNQTWQ